ncbi:MAG TPA: glycosyltransferase family 4 protein [Anaerolineae bacterium]
MKIALVSPYDFPYPGGVTEHITALAAGVQERGHEVHILAACSAGHNQTSVNTRVVTNNIISVPVGGAMARVGLSPFSYRRLRRILQREAFDVIHLHEPLTPGIAWYVLMQSVALSHTVTVGTFHAYHENPNWFYVRGRPIFNRFFARLDSLIAVSGPACHFASRLFPGDYRIIPNGVDLNRFGQTNGVGPKSDLAAAPGKTTILFVGRLDRRKGFSHLLQAFMRIRPRYPQLCLKVVGPFDSRSCGAYRKLVEAQGVTDIEFVGYVSPEQLPAVYRGADIFCAPSIGFESFGIVLLEAMAAGLPVVASDIAGYRSVLTHGQEGLLVPPGQPEPLAQALVRLINDVQVRQAMARRGRLKAGRYDWNRIVDQVLEVYYETMEHKMKTPSPFLQGVHIQRQVNSEGKSC